MALLQDVFQGQALTYEAFMEALEEKGGLSAVGDPVDGCVADALYERALQELQEARDTIAALRAQVDEWMERYEVDLAEVRKEAAVDVAILRAGGRNVKAIRALLDLDKVVLLEDGSLQGLDLEALKASDGYLFYADAWERRGTGFTESGVLSRDCVSKQFEEAVWAR